MTQEIPSKEVALISEEERNEEKEDTTCGVGSIRPKVLQKFANMPMFTFINSGATLITSTLSAYIASQIPSLEKQFGLSSYESGILMSFNDIGFLLFCLFVTSIARYVHIPRFLFYCGICFGISGVICALPHFLTPRDLYMSQYQIDTETSKNNTDPAEKIQLCFMDGANGTGTNRSREECSVEGLSEAAGRITYPDVKKMALSVIALGMFFQGVGKAPRTSFVTVYVDDNTEKRKTGFYIGIMSCASILGSALAYGLGAIFSTIYVTTEPVDMDTTDPRWIGAWWIGFLLFGFASLVIVFPLICFPWRLKRKLKNETKQPKENVVPATLKEKITDRLLSYYRVMRVPVYLLILITNCCQVLSTVGYISFLIKYIETQWGRSLFEANIILGVTQLLAIALGVFLGGWITKRVNMTPRNAFLWLMIMFIFQNVFFSSGFFLGCDQADFIGPQSIHGQHTIKSNCSASCDCTPDEFFPVCGSDNLNYHSPCFAGCSNLGRGGRIFTNCSCIPDGMATAGQCTSNECHTLIPWAVINFVYSVVGSIKMMISFVAKIRCVKDKDKSTAMGLQTFLLSLVGFMPAPIIFGKIVDSTCLIWQSSCDTKGACLYYDIVDFRIKLYAYSLFLAIIAMASTAIALGLTWKWRNWKQLESKDNETVIETSKDTRIDNET